jgi:hypothetical protein
MVLDGQAAHGLAAMIAALPGKHLNAVYGGFSKIPPMVAFWLCGVMA